LLSAIVLDDEDETFEEIRFKLNARMSSLRFTDLKGALTGKVLCVVSVKAVDAVVSFSALSITKLSRLVLLEVGIKLGREDYLTK